MSKWSEYYKDRVNNSAYESYVKSKYIILFQLLEYYGRLSENFIEEGCGIGTIAKLFHKKSNIPGVLLDNDASQLRLAKQNTNNAFSYLKSSILDDSSTDADIVFSHGVLEHFQDSDIKKIIHKQIRCTRHAVVHYVPTDWYKEPSFGDERLLSPKYWKELVNPTVMEVNEGDLFMAWTK